MTTRKTFLGRAVSALGLLVLGPEKLWAAIRRPTIREALADGGWHRFTWGEDSLYPTWSAVDGVLLSLDEYGLVPLAESPMSTYDWDLGQYGKTTLIIRLWPSPEVISEEIKQHPLPNYLSACWTNCDDRWVYGAEVPHNWTHEDYVAPPPDKYLS